MKSRYFTTIWNLRDHRACITNCIKNQSSFFIQIEYYVHDETGKLCAYVSDDSHPTGVKPAPHMHLFMSSVSQRLMSKGDPKPHSCNRFKFRVFLLRDQLPFQGLRTQICPTYLPIAGGCIAFPSILLLCEMQTRFQLRSLCPFSITITATL